MIAEEYRRHNEKIDLMMEIERLKELQLQEEREKIRKEEQYAGSIVIIDQIKERDYERMKALDQKEKEKLIMLRQVKELENEEIRNHERKSITRIKIKQKGDRLSKSLHAPNQKH